MQNGKAEIRERFLQQRDGIAEDRRMRMDADIAAQVLASPEYRRATLLLPYLSFGAEVDTRAIIQAAWGAGKAVALPRCLPGRLMAWHKVESLDGLVRSKFGVDEPADDPATLVDAGREDALALVPGLAFDARGFRIGYGGGFYDVFLAGFPGASIGLCRECQLSGALDHLDAHDLPVQAVATESRLIRCPA